MDDFELFVGAVALLQVNCWYWRKQYISVNIFILPQSWVVCGRIVRAAVSTKVRS